MDGAGEIAAVRPGPFPRLASRLLVRRLATPRNAIGHAGWRKGHAGYGPEPAHGLTVKLAAWREPPHPGVSPATLSARIQLT